MLFSVEMIEASAPSVTCVISRVDALNPAAQPVSETARVEITTAEIMRRIGVILSHQISSQ
jgi:hypothetical protein